MKAIAYYFAVVVSFVLLWSITGCEQKEDEPNAPNTTATNTNKGGGGTSNSGQNSGQNNTQNSDDSDDISGVSHNRTQEDDFTVDIPNETDGDISVPLSIVALDDVVDVSFFCTDEQVNNTDIQYQIIKRNGNTGAWTPYKSKDTKVTLSKGDKVCFCGNNLEGFNKLGNYLKFVIEGKAAALGNIMSLIKGDGFQDLTEIPNDYCFARLFEGCSSLVTAPMLPAKVLKPSCYRDMFAKCIALTTAPKFRAEKLAEYCCFEMFDDCKELVNVSDFPDIELADFCFNTMFKGCKALTTAPSLPSQKLAKACYSNMFKNCTSLERAPDLPALMLDESCYSRMFEGCSKLGYINIKAIDWNADKKATEYWVLNIGVNGIFYCPDNLEIKNGHSAIPDGWTVISNGAGEDPRPILSAPILSKSGKIIIGDELLLTISANMICNMSVKKDGKVLGSCNNQKDYTVMLPTDVEGKFHIVISASNGNFNAKDVEFDYYVEKTRLIVNYELSNSTSTLTVGDKYSANISTNIAADIVVKVNGEAVSVSKASDNHFSVVLPTHVAGKYNVVISGNANGVKSDDISFAYTVVQKTPTLSIYSNSISSVTYGVTANVTATANMDCKITMYVNDVPKETVSNSPSLTFDLSKLVIGTYKIKFKAETATESAETAYFMCTVSQSNDGTATVPDMEGEDL